MTPQWTEPAMWIGILRGDQLVALIIRRGMFDANGKCQVNVNDMRRVEARRIKAIDVEMHCVSLCDIGYLIPSDAILALGWTSGRFAFNYRGAPAVICDSARKGFSGGLRMLPHRLWPLVSGNASQGRGSLAPQRPMPA